MLSIAEKIAALKKTKLFSDVITKDLEGIAAVAQEVKLTDGQTIFQADDIGDAIYFIVQGRMRAHKSGVDLTVLEANECVGEMAVIDAGPRSASVSSIGDSTLLRVSREDFYRVMQNNTGLLQNALSLMLRKLREHTNKEIEAVRQRERIVQDLSRAREMQMSMLPTQDLCIAANTGLSVRASGSCYPAEAVGGDYYDYFPLPERNVGIVIGDVMGHGFHAGLMVAMAKSCLQMQIKSDYSISRVMTAMNDMVYGFIQSGLFMTFCYMIFNLQNNTLSFSNAGHVYPYHYRTGIKKLDILESDSCPLGILECQNYDVTQSEWDKGDIFVLYSDGIIEAENRSGADFGAEKLKQLIIDNINLSPVNLKETILQEYRNFCEDVTQADDVSLVIVKMGETAI